MILVKVAGGLGNQLFQYATARSLCHKHNVPFLFFDTRHFKNDYLGRQFGLQYFNIKGSVLKNRSALNAFTKDTKVNRFVSLLGIYKNITEGSFALHDLNTKWFLFTSLSGYWQSPVYFESIRDLLLEELVPLKLSAFPPWVHEMNTVAVGVRRTDYLVDLKYGFIGLKYYQDAFALMKKKIKDPLFIIFSDDMAWCKENFKNEQILFFEDANWAKDYLQLYLISKCKHQIIANSSFSWWGAWLNSNKEKVVTRPSQPFTDPSLLYEKHYPEQWIAI